MSIDGCGCPIVESFELDCEQTWDNGAPARIYETEECLPVESRCCECKETLPSDSYAIVAEIWICDEDGNEIMKLPDYKATCIPCYRIRSSLYCGWTVLGELRAMIWEHLGFDYITGEYNDQFESDDI